MFYSDQHQPSALPNCFANLAGTVVGIASRQRELIGVRARLAVTGQRFRSSCNTRVRRHRGGRGRWARRSVVANNGSAEQASSRSTVTTPTWRAPPGHRWLLGTRRCSSNGSPPSGSAAPDAFPSSRRRVGPGGRRAPPELDPGDDAPPLPAPNLARAAGGLLPHGPPSSGPGWSAGDRPRPWRLPVQGLDLSWRSSRLLPPGRLHGRCPGWSHRRPVRRWGALNRSVVAAVRWIPLRARWAQNERSPRPAIA